MNNIVNENIYFEEKKPYYIYIHTCPNYWVYVGLSQNPKQKWNNGEGYKESKEFYNSIKEFGWNNIKHEIVAETKYKWIAQKIERTIITHFKQKNKCFNEANIERVLLEKKSKRKVPLKKVAQYDKNRNLIKVYNSVSEIEKNTHFSGEYIRNCCAGRLKTAYKYIWRYI